MTEKLKPIGEIISEVELLSEIHLKLYHFPLMCPYSTPDVEDYKNHQIKANVYNKPHKVYSVIPGSGKRNCTRCHLVYNVNENIKGNKCSYHPRSLTGSPSQPLYSCCGGDSNAALCQTKEFHVSNDVDLDDMSGFAMTKNSHRANYHMVNYIVLDCQFVYTTHGLEICTVTVLGNDSKKFLNELVKPDNPIIDYRENVTGLSKEDFQYKNNLISIEELKSYLMNVCDTGYSNAIIIGHGLAETFLRIRLIHDNVIDTALLFEMTDGKNLSLEVLTQKYLGDLDYSDVTISKGHQNCIKIMKLIRVAHEKKMSCRNLDIEI